MSALILSVADPLAAFFLLVVTLGGMAASLYGLGYGRHETAPLRVLPFYAAFLAGMNLVVLAADAFTFLLSWEFMSLASWPLGRWCCWAPAPRPAWCRCTSGCRWRTRPPPVTCRP
ncbi:MAG: hypothetical protein RQ826_14075 [Xanthomonadales bacterium]|nr:hypothetical protein [Xanthomonadales bacterium]